MVNRLVNTGEHVENKGNTMRKKKWCAWHTGCSVEVNPNPDLSQTEYCEFHQKVRAAFFSDAQNYLNQRGLEFIMTHGYKSLEEVVAAANNLRRLQQILANLSTEYDKSSTTGAPNENR
jgi:hypothetical protein